MLIVIGLASHEPVCREPVPTMYSMEEDVITCVGLAPVKPGVFMAAVKYVLVVATGVEVVLLGVCFSGNDPACQVRYVSAYAYIMATRTQQSVLC